ncbi:conserved hypothetical protein [Ricinus communis]|uniref:Aldehyde dehydrogenase domain-containing protein n=1 Tax=Ricinus communis TaxID=3988 RepID=B9RIC1_RICCO|nr:conserved hypothetical protein [Ricinus communis]
MESATGLESELESMRQYFRSGKTKDASWRLSQLKGLLLFIKDKETEIFKALKQDLGKHHGEAFRDEVGTSIKSINYALKGLKESMSSQAAKNCITLFCRVGCLVLIISSTVLGTDYRSNSCRKYNGSKTFRMGPASSALLANTLPNYLDNKAIKVIQGGPSVGEQLLLQKWDKISFTGSLRVGRTVMSAVVKHLTPVVLELGGKSCIAIDYILVEQRFSFTLLLKVAIKKMFGDDPRKTNTIARMVNKHHFLRVKNLISDLAVQKSVVYGGSMDEDSLFIEPTILLNPPLGAEIMTDEIFGPLLPIITLNKIEDNTEFINSMPKALAIYAFTKNEHFRRRMTAETSSGSLVFNDAIIQVFLLDLSNVILVSHCLF